VPEPGPLGKLLRLLGIATALLWSGFPIYLVVASSLKPGTEIFAVPPTLVFWPTLEHYERLWREWPEFFRDMRNSLIITAGATLLTAVTASAAGYVYSRRRSGPLAASAFFMLFVRMLPPIIVTLPLFPAVNWLGLSDTHIVLVMLYATFFVSLNTWIMKAFIDQIPVELEEAAIVDGCSLPRLLWNVVIPMSRPALVAVAMYTFILAWNEFLFALVFTNGLERRPLSVALAFFIDENGIRWGELMAASIVMSLPAILVFSISQKLLVRGLGEGALKG